MIRTICGSPWRMLAIGLFVGIGLGSAAVWHFHTPRIQFPTTLLNATATHGGTTMAMATGPIDGGVEGLFVLDFITGDLTCNVINPRTGSLGGLFNANVVADLGVEQGKQPQYLMVTGAAEFATGGGNVKPADSIIYVADANTGRYVAYWLPWNRQAQQFNVAQAQTMIVLGKGSARNLQVE